MAFWPSPSLSASVRFILSLALVPEYSTLRKNRHLHPLLSFMINCVAERAYSSNANANLYEISRPSYPHESINFIVTYINNNTHNNNNNNNNNVKILDLAAGTGKFTRLLMPFFNDIVAVEPVPEMIKSFSNILPSIPIHQGTATNIPLKDSSVNVVVVAQAFHWFANKEAIKEIHRVLSPGGYFFLIWNMEDSGANWVKDLRDAYEQFDGIIPQYRLGSWKSVWEHDKDESLFRLPLSHQSFDWNMPGNNKDMICNRVKSKSYVSCLDETIRNELLCKIERILDEHRLFDTKDAIDFPYVTDVYWTIKL